MCSSLLFSFSLRYGTGYNPHFISTDGNAGTQWALVERMYGWGGAGGIHELTPVGPAGRGPDGTWLGPPGVSGVVEYFIQFAGKPRYTIDLWKVHWQNSTTDNTADIVIT